MQSHRQAELTFVDLALELAHGSPCLALDPIGGQNDVRLDPLATCTLPAARFETRIWNVVFADKVAEVQLHFACPLCAFDQGSL
jgi:hypothetical protein